MEHSAFPEIVTPNSERLMYFKGENYCLHAVIHSQTILEKEVGCLGEKVCQNRGKKYAFIANLQLYVIPDEHINL